MPVDYTAIYSKFISVTQTAVGSYLSTTGPAGAPEPSVIQRRPSGPHPDYSYISIDILDTGDESGWMAFEEVDINDNVTISTYEKMLINFRCYGKNSFEVMNTLKHYFRIESVRNDIREALAGSIVDVLDIDSLPIELSDGFLESSDFNVIFNIIATQTDTSTGIIDNIDLDGEVYRDEEDPTPYTTNTTVP